MDKQIKVLQQAINQASNIVFFTGAGLSTASGIPDFRSADGLYQTDFGTAQPAEVMLSRDFMDKYPTEAVRFSVEVLHHPEAKPNAGHQYMASLAQEAGKNVRIITQNIDGLHTLAGSQQTLELHGNQRQQICLSCRHEAAATASLVGGDGLPHCSLCGGLMRDTIVLYGEPLDQDVVADAIQAISQADLLIIVGTSLQVYPAAGFVDYFKGDHIYVINKSTVTVNRLNVTYINGDANHIFQTLALGGLGGGASD